MAMLNNHSQSVNLHISSSFFISYVMSQKSLEMYVTEAMELCVESSFLDVPKTPIFVLGASMHPFAATSWGGGRWQIPMSILANAENRNLSDLYRAPWRWSTASQTSCKQAKNNRTMCGIWMMNFYDFVEYVNTYAYIYIYIYIWVFIGCSKTSGC